MACFNFVVPIAGKERFRSSHEAKVVSISEACFNRHGVVFCFNFSQAFRGKNNSCNAANSGAFGGMKLTIELSEIASVIITEMARRCDQRPEAIARICTETTLAQSIDDFIAEEPDLWLLTNASDPEKVCQEYWEEVEKPGSYTFALKRNGFLAS
jgi:hypothetical protein